MITVLTYICVQTKTVAKTVHSNNDISSLGIPHLALICRNQNPSLAGSLYPWQSRQLYWKFTDDLRVYQSNGLHPLTVIVFGPSIVVVVVLDVVR